MSSSTLDPSAYLRTLLILGRTSNLPTVWSNCLAGWILGGEGNLKNLLLLSIGATLLYLGGMGIMVWNVAKTATAGRYRPVRIPALMPTRTPPMAPV